MPRRWTDGRTWGKLFSSQAHGAPVAQLDRASGYEPEGREFESPRAHQLPLTVLTTIPTNHKERGMIRLAISNFFVSLLVMVCVCPLGSAQQPKTTASITIEVTDQTGAPIPGARARIVPYPHDISSSRLETNADGK